MVRQPARSMHVAIPDRSRDLGAQHAQPARQRVKRSPLSEQALDRGDW